jgi:hypothetical protein
VNETQNSYSQDEQSITRAPAVPFILMPGEKITDCFGLWAASDRVLEELGKCFCCHRPTFRVVTIRIAGTLERGTLERRAALCGQHFVLAARQYPELDQNHNSGAA